MDKNTLPYIALVISTVCLLANAILYIKVDNMNGLLMDVSDTVAEHSVSIHQLFTIQNATVDLLNKTANLVLSLYNETTELENSVNHLEDRYMTVSYKVNVLDSKVSSLYNYYQKLSSNLSDLYSKYLMIELVAERNIADRFKVYDVYDIENDIVGKYGEEISDEEISSILESELEDIFEEDLLDYKYIAYDENILRKTLYEIYLYLKSHNYIEDYFDCDDYALTTLGILRENLPGAACFVVYYNVFDIWEGFSAHTQLLCITKDKRILYFEPQTGEFKLSFEDGYNFWIFG